MGAQALASRTVCRSVSAMCSSLRLTRILSHLDGSSQGPASILGRSRSDNIALLRPHSTKAVMDSEPFSAPSPIKSQNKVSPFLMGNFAPVREELDYGSLQLIAGKLPAGLRGVVARNGSNPQFDITGPYQWFDGDGMLHVVDIDVDEQGVVHTLRYRNRYVRTARLALDAKKGYSSAPIGHMLRGDPRSYMELKLQPENDDEDYELLYGTANTSVVHHAGQFLALHEGDHAYAVDIETLETKGRFSYNGGLKHRFTAHPKLDPVTKELVFFGCNQSPSSPAFMHYSVADSHGQLIVANLPIELRGPQVMHDIAITEHFSVILDFPLFVRPERFAEGKSPYVHDLSMPSRFGLLPRHAGSSSEVRWFEASPCFMYHVANAWEHDGGVSIVGCRSPFMDQGGLGSSVFRLHRWDLDLNTGLVQERQLSPLQCEFCVVDGQLVGRYARYVYAARFADQKDKMSAGPVTFDGLIKADLETGVITEHLFDDGLLGGEALFARCGGKGLDGEGVLMTFAFNPASSSSELYIVDCVRMTCTARIALPQRVPYGFHGTWVPATSL